MIPPRSDASALNNPAPEYPPRSRTFHEQGRVQLDVYILPDGTVGQIKLHTSSGYSRLDNSALDAVRRWHYIPAKRGDVPIPYWYVQPIDGSTGPRRVGDGGVPIRDSAGGSIQPSVVWAPDGSAIYYKAMIEDRVDVWRAAADGSGKAAAGAEASATTVTTVITGGGPGEGGGEHLAQRQDEAAASIEQFAGVTLDEEARAEITASRPTGSSTFLITTKTSPSTTSRESTPPPPTCTALLI